VLRSLMGSPTSTCPGHSLLADMMSHVAISLERSNAAHQLRAILPAPAQTYGSLVALTEGAARAAAVGLANASELP
jgi:hypothetical protein